MTTVIINAGVGYSRDGEKLDHTNIAEVITDIRRYLALLAGGFTESNTAGGWVNDEGELILEPGIQWVIAGMGKETAKDAAQYIGRMLAQDSVLVSFIESEFQLERVQYETV